MIPALTLTNIVFTYPGTSEPLLDGIDVTFARGWTAVLGDNGIGKTTLAKLAIGRLSPDAGRISPTPNRLHTGYCPQNTDETPENLEDFACDWSPQAMEIRRELGIGDDWPWRPGTLSGGEAKRLQIACALATDPDVLVLDEPTNHVDRPTHERIIAALRSYDGIGILVSHDVALIDAVASSCALFERDHVRGHNITVVRVRPGNYSAASMDAQRERAAAAGMARNARRESTRIDAVKEQRRRAATSEIAGAPKAHRLVNPKDHDARSRIKKSHNPSRLGPASARIDAQAAAARERAAAVVTATKRYDGDIWMDAESSNRRELVRLEPQIIPYAPQSPDGVGAAAISETAGLKIPMLTVGPHDRIGISGPNGTGKTTLVRTLLRTIAMREQYSGVPLPRLTIAQNTTDQDAREAMRRLTALTPTDRGDVLSAFAQLNVDPSRLLAGGNPSPGELRKLLLCLGLRDHPHLIVMDEPTNHLDLHSIQALAHALAGYPGALLLVSHDEGFLECAASIRWTLHSDGLGGAQLTVS